MINFKSILDLVFVMLSLTPFIGVGYYFGRLEKRIAANENKTGKIDKRVSFLELNLGVKT